MKYSFQKTRLKAVAAREEGCEIGAGAPQITKGNTTSFVYFDELADEEAVSRVAKIGRGLKNVERAAPYPSGLNRAGWGGLL